MKTCKDIARYASDYIENEMSFGQRFSIKLHLLFCHHCQNFMNQFKLLSSSFKMVAKPESISREQVDKLYNDVYQSTEK